MNQPLSILATAVLSVGAFLGVSSEAQAAVPTAKATAFISNGFFFDLGTIDGIRTVHFGRIGTLQENGNSWALSMQMTCELELATDALDCDGTMSLNGNSADIWMGHEDGDGYWAIESVPTALRNAHIALLRTHIWPESQRVSKTYLPPGWSLVDVGGPYLWYQFNWDWVHSPWESDDDCLFDPELIC
jgi:hypothetical protein